MICLKALPLLVLFSGCLAAIASDSIESNEGLIGKLYNVAESPEAVDVIDGDDESNVLKGQKTDITHHPHQALLKFNGKPIGSGVILNEHYIITNAYTPFIKKYITVSVGQSQVSKSKTNLEIEKVVLHPKFSFGTDYAVSLLKLKHPLKFSKSVKGIEVATQTPKEGSSAVVSGWGLKTPKPFKPSNDLLQSTQKVISNKSCKHYYIASTISETILCAYKSQQEKPTYYDGGDPLVQNNKLVGVFFQDLSNPAICANTHKCPGVYTDVTKLHSWIHHTIAQK